jgi:hypothetical protein
MKLHLEWLFVACFGMILSAPGQNAATSSVSVSVPPVLQFSNVATDEGGTPLTGTVSITFSLYNSSQGGQPLWTETQNVHLGNAGQYSVYLGLTQANGLPTNLFTSGQAQWLGVKIESQAEQPRVFLVSVPYAMKAGDAATIGGLPPSAFVMAAPPAGSSTAATTTPDASASSLTPATNGDVTGLGTVDYIPIWDSTSDIISSVLYQSGTGSTAKIGINTTTPASTLDIKGGGTVRGTLSLPTTGTATASAGKDSQPIRQAASAYNSSTSTAVNQTFQWQAEPANNDTSSASGTLNLLFGEGTAAPAETGLHIASNGQINFATGQTFPGTGDGTVTGVTTASGSGLTGGGTSGTLSLGLTTACAASQVLEWNGSAWGCAAVGAGTITGVTPGTDLTGGGTTGNVTLNLNTSLVPQLNAANTFTGNQTVSGNLSATGVVTGSSYQIGSNLFAFGSYSNGNAFSGFGGNTTMTGSGNTASGVSALNSNANGVDNTASGFEALYSNATGSSNAASGYTALEDNTTGSYNTASGYKALLTNTAGSYNTAGGASALLTSTGAANTALGFEAGDPTNDGLTTGSNDTFLGSNANPGTQLALINASAIGANAQVTESNALVLGSINNVNGATASVNVGIGTTAPAYALDVYGTGHFTQAVTFGSPVNFASGQTFPGTGTITGVTAGSGLSGGGSSGGVTLNLASNTCTSGSALTALPFTCSPFATLGANTFAGNETVSGNLTATGVVSGSSFQIGSNLFAYGSYDNSNAFLGFAGNTGANNSSNENTAVGFAALLSNTTGSNNTAIGFVALRGNTSGSGNTAVGGGETVFGVLSTNTTGGNNTAIGYDAGGTYDESAMTASSNTFVGANAGASTGTLTNATAIGANSEVSESNAMVLGSIDGVFGATASTNVGIGTTAPASTLDVEGTLAAGSAPIVWFRNDAALQSGATGNAVDIRFTPDGGGAVGTPNAYVRAQEDGDSSYGTSLQLGTVTDGSSGAAERMRITSGGDVGIGTTAPDTLLSVNGGADKPGGGSWGTFSDRRLKNVDGNFSSGLDRIMKLNPILYRYKADNGMGITDREEHVGVVAQEVQKVIPEAVTENSKGYLLVNNDPIIWAMLNAIKEQQKEIEAQRRIINKQQKLTNAQRRLTNAQQREISRLNRKVGALVVSLRTTNSANSAVILAPPMGNAERIKEKANPRSVEHHPQTTTAGGEQQREVARLSVPKTKPGGLR